MKKILLLVLLAVVAIPYYIYGQDDTHVTVHVGEERLSDLLTEEQKSSVTHLKVTGTLKREDYAFLRENMQKNLKELNLRDTDIDTIPTRAFTGMRLDFLLVLPFNIKHIGYDVVDYWWMSIEVSGHFPTWERYDNYYFTVSEDNPCCRKTSENEYGYSIYSIDGETLYYMVDYDPHDYEITRYEIAEGTKTICAAVFRDWDVFMGTNFIFPSSLDSIGDYAFDGLRLLIPTCFSSTSSFRYPNGAVFVCMICEALVPPKLGANVFPIDSGWFDWNFHMTLYVPEASLEEYKSTAGWCDFRKIRTIEWLIESGGFPAPPQSVNDIKITSSSSSYTLHFRKLVRHMDLYNLQGILLESYDLQSMTATVDKTLLSSPYALARVHYADGTAETIKLKP